MIVVVSQDEVIVDLGLKNDLVRYNKKERARILRGAAGKARVASQALADEARRAEREAR